MRTTAHFDLNVVSGVAQVEAKVLVRMEEGGNPAERAMAAEYAKAIKADQVPALNIRFYITTIAKFTVHSQGHGCWKNQQWRGCMIASSKRYCSLTSGCQQGAASQHCHALTDPNANVYDAGCEAAVLLHAACYLLAAPQLAVRVHLDDSPGEGLFWAAKTDVHPCA